MKKIKPSKNPQQWPRALVKSVETRSRDLVIRISDWTDQPDDVTGGHDVEVYIGGVYDWGASDNFDKKKHAVAFAQKQIEKLL